MGKRKLCTRCTDMEGTPTGAIYAGNRNCWEPCPECARLSHTWCAWRLDEMFEARNRNCRAGGAQ